MVASNQGHAVADDLMADPIARRAPMIRRDPMADSPSGRWDPQIRRPPNSSGLYDVLDLILDKGIVIDAFVRVSLVGIELLTIDLRVVVASVDTYLRYAEGVERLQIRGDEKTEPKSLPGMVSGGMKGGAMKQGAKSIGRAMFGHGDDSEEEDNSKHGVIGALSKGVRRAVGRVAGALSGDESEYEDQDDRDEGGDEGEEDSRPQAKKSKQESGGKRR